MKIQSLGRISITLLALICGVMLLFGLTFIGQRSEGPVDAFFGKVTDMISRMEDRFILNQRTVAREESTGWFKYSPAEMLYPSRILTGAFDDNADESLKPLFELEEALHTTFAFIHIYTAWGSKPDQQFPKTAVRSILRSGSVPLITWEPWLNDFDPKDFMTPLRPKEVRDKHGLRDVADGLYDAYIRAWAREAASIREPLFVRFGHEMNDPYRYPWGPQNNTNEEFIDAWRHVYGIFREEGAVNVLWVWSPHPAYGWFNEYFPGADYVDWVGVGVLNYGTVAPWSQWWTFEEIFGKHYAALAEFGKPIMISEFGSLVVGGDRVEWLADALETIRECYPMIRAVLFFHYSYDQTTTLQPLDWTVINDTAAVRTIAREVSGW